LEESPIIRAEIVSLEEMTEIMLESILFVDLKQIYLYESLVVGLSSLSQYPNLKIFFLNNCDLFRGEESFDCCQIDTIFISSPTLQHLKNCSRVKHVTVYHLSSDDLLVSLFSGVQSLWLHSSTVSNLPIFKELTFLALISCSEIVRLETSTLPCLNELRVNRCPNLVAVIVSGSFTNKVEWLGELPELELIDIKTPSVRKLFLTNVQTKKTIRLKKSHVIPGLIISGTSVEIRFCERETV
jgi:hypothetical protein